MGKCCGTRRDSFFRKSVARSSRAKERNACLAPCCGSVCARAPLCVRAVCVWERESRVPTTFRPLLWKGGSSAHRQRAPSLGSIGQWKYQLDSVTSEPSDKWKGNNQNDDNQDVKFLQFPRSCSWRRPAAASAAEEWR